MFVGIDIGGTKTHVAVDTGDRVDEVVVPTASWQRDDGFSVASAGRLLAVRDVPLTDPRWSLAIGAHGVDSPEDARSLESAVRHHWAGALTVRNDAELLLPAAGVDRGICLIVGTGSIVVGRDGSGRLVTVGGHGWLLDDDGSAPGLVRDAARAVLRDIDHGRPADELARALMRHFGAPTLFDLSRSVTERASMASWAAAAPLVFSAADAGSGTALRVIDEAAARLADDLVLCRARGAVGDVAVAAGGVVTHQPRLFSAVQSRLRQRDPDLVLTLLEVEPVVGALELARAAADAAPGHPPASVVTRPNTTGGTR